MKLKLLLLLSFILQISVFSQPTLKEKIAQMVMVGFSGTTVPDSLKYDIQNRKLGGVVLFGANITNPTQLKNLTSQLQSLWLTIKCTDFRRSRRRTELPGLIRTTDLPQQILHTN